MVRVGFERDGVVVAPHAQQHDRHDQVDNGSGHGNRQANPDLRQGPWRNQPRHRRDRNADRRHEDQPPFDTTRKILRLGVAVGVIFIGRTRRHRQHRHRHDPADQIDDRLDRVREQPDRPGDQVSGRLQHDREESGHDRDPGETGEPGAIHVVGLVLTTMP